MSGSLFQLFYADDVAGATAILSRDGLQMGSTTVNIGGRDNAAFAKLSKQDINKRDAQGRTVLHLAASKGSLEFVKALLDNPATDVNLLDMESGWTALHRALYYGRIACAQYIIASRGRDTIKIKDREGNSPFDVLNSTLNGTNPPPLYDEKGGSDLFTFGSNKNNSLGFGDGDDRSHPERVQIIRSAKKEQSPLSMFRPPRIRDVQMARLHTAILTTETKDNLYMCGFNGTTGRLGLSTNHTGTQFLPKPVTGIGDQVAHVALGQEHTIAVTKSGAVYTWGSNQHGQLGYTLDVNTNKDNVQRVPRKIIAPLKRVDIIGIAASAYHSICFSAEDLYTWGLNRGQLGYPSADDGPIQTVPKKVATLPAPVEMVTAIDNATICLLKNKAVFVFANGGYFRVYFPLDLFADNMARVSMSSVFRPRQMYAPNLITKVTSGGTTVCAVSSMGDVFSFTIPENSNLKPHDLAKSTKAQRIWSLRRRHMAVRDVAVGQEGTVIISTESGSVWTRVRRSTPKVSQREGPKEYKFARVGFLTRIVAVRANSAGAYAAIRNDVELQSIDIEEEGLERDLIMAIPLGEVVNEVIGDSGDQAESVGSSVASDQCEEEILKPWSEIFAEMPPPPESCDAALVVRDGHRIYLHKAILACRSTAFQEFLRNPNSTEFIVTMEDNIFEISLPEVGLVAAAQLVHFLYTDKFLDLPEYLDKHKPERLEMILHLRYLATKFQLKQLSDNLTSSWYLILEPRQKLLHNDLRELQSLPHSISAPDAVLALADREVPCHSFILAARCPFFEAMLSGARMGGGWTAHRRKEALAEGSSEFRIQLPHFSYNVISIVLEHIYCDAGIEVFDKVRKENVDAFLEFVIEVLAVANELLLERLKDVCQSVLARFVTLRNVATILEEADTYAAEQLKDACLNYCAINAEAILENRLFEDLEPDLMSDFEIVIRRKQIERLPISRGEVLLADLTARYPNLEDDILQEREARQFTSILGASLSSSFGAQSLPSTPLDFRNRDTPKPGSGRRNRKSATPVTRSPVLRPAPGSSDLIFDMDDDLEQGSPLVKTSRPTPASLPEQARNPWRDVNGRPLKEQPPNFTANQRFKVLPESVSTATNGNDGWSEVKTPVRVRKDITAKAGDSVPRTPVSQQPTPSRPSQMPIASGPQSPSVPLVSPSLSTPGASPWKKPETTPPISFKSLVEEQRNQTLSSTFPPSSHSNLPQRPVQTPKPAPTQPKLSPSTPSDPPVRRNSTTPIATSSAANTPSQIRSVPGKSFQQPPKPATTSPKFPDMFPALGSSPKNFADIMAQQTSEQAALNAKAMPRSLKEIQEEEQFLQWWEQESQRIKEEKELASKTAVMSVNSGGAADRGRGRGGRGGAGRGRGTRGRGDGRGRGRGDANTLRGSVVNRGK